MSLCVACENRHITRVYIALLGQLGMLTAIILASSRTNMLEDSYPNPSSRYTPDYYILI